MRNSPDSSPNRLFFVLRWKSTTRLLVLWSVAIVSGSLMVVSSPLADEICSHTLPFARFKFWTS
jgi:hypothetical protein